MFIASTRECTHDSLLNGLIVFALTNSIIRKAGQLFTSNKYSLGITPLTEKSQGTGADVYRKCHPF